MEFILDFERASEWANNGLPGSEKAKSKVVAASQWVSLQISCHNAAWRLMFAFNYSDVLVVRSYTYMKRNNL